MVRRHTHPSSHSPLPCTPSGLQPLIFPMRISSRNGWNTTYRKWTGKERTLLSVTPDPPWWPWSLGLITFAYVHLSASTLTQWSMPSPPAGLHLSAKPENQPSLSSARSQLGLQRDQQLLLPWTKAGFQIHLKSHLNLDSGPLVTPKSIPNSPSPSKLTFSTANLRQDAKNARHSWGVFRGPQALSPLT